MPKTQDWANTEAVRRPPPASICRAARALDFAESVQKREPYALQLDMRSPLTVQVENLCWGLLKETPTARHSTNDFFLKAELLSAGLHQEAIQQPVSNEAG
jgi:hypothetical protein